MNRRIYDTRHAFGDAQSAVVRQLGMDQAVFRATARNYFDDAEALSNGLLHALATAQELVEGPTCWRGAWRDEFRYCGLRVLAYHPGPQVDTQGNEIHTTARHTDATWLTLLMNDDRGGLHIATSTGDVAVNPPVAGALLVNTGNVMAKASGGFFKAVCHWVLRTDRTESQTRVSMPFFYDRSDDSQTTSFWNGGTGGC